MLKRHLTVGGISLAVSCEEPVNLGGDLDRFVAPGDGGGGIPLRLERVNALSERAYGRPVFESGATWGMYGCPSGGKGATLTVPALRNGKRTMLSADFDDDFRKGTVFFRKNGEMYFLYPFLEVLTINILGTGRGVLLHACCIDDNGEGYLFLGQSGAGKSTMAKLWDGKKGIRILSDDRVIVTAAGGGLIAHGTPWHGTAQYALNESVPLKRVFFISHAEKNRFSRVQGIRAVSELARTAFLPFWSRSGMEFSLDFLGRFERCVNLFLLGFIPHESAVDFVRSM